MTDFVDKMLELKPKRDSKRRLSAKDIHILYRNANKRCQNPACGKIIEYEDEMEVGHKKAWSKGGKTTLDNSVCLCSRCNRDQGTDSWAVFLKKQGVVVKDPKSDMRAILETLSLSQLKSLAKKHYIKIKGKVKDDFFSISSPKETAPARKQYVTKLSGIVTKEDIDSLPKEMPKVQKRKKKKKVDSWF